MFGEVNFLERRQFGNESNKKTMMGVLTISVENEELEEGVL